MKKSNIKKANNRWQKVLLTISIVSVISFGAIFALVGAYNYYWRTDSKIQVQKINYSTEFNDNNRIQLKVAQKHGVKRIPKNRKEAKKQESELTKIENNENYLVDRLTQSVPYLTHGAAEVLKMIGENFQDSLESKGLSKYRIIVTSVLRTQEDVKNLRSSGNINAVSNSAHCYATTFDISYARFYKSKLWAKRADKQILKNVLAEVLRDLRKRKLCFVKYEYNQKCFHITVNKSK